MNARLPAIFEEDYELIASIGSGGMGTVSKARDRWLGQLVPRHQNWPRVAISKADVPPND